MKIGKALHVLIARNFAQAT